MAEISKLIAKLAEDIGKYAPVTIEGKSGRGKTYVLKKLREALESDGSSCQVNFTSGDRVFESFLKALRENQSAAWKAEFLQGDAIFIDDFDILEGKTHMQETLWELFKSSGRPVTIAVSKPLTKERFSDKLVQFFATGVHVCLPTLKTEQVREFAADFAGKNHVIFSEEGLAWIADQGFDRFSVLEGFLKTVAFHAEEGQPVPIELCRRLADRFWKNENTAKITTGLTELDDLLGYFHPGALYAIAGRPAMGKTALMLDILLHAAVRERQPVHLFSLELSEEHLMRRLERKRKDTDLLDLETAPIHIYDQPFCLDEVLEVIDKQVDAGIVLIDYIQLVMLRGSERGHPYDAKAMQAIVTQLLQTARRKKLPIVFASQVIRGVDDREDKHPLLEDLRLHGGLGLATAANYLDGVIFIYREAYYDTECGSDTAELCLASNQFGPTGTARVRWNKKTLCFEDVE